MRKRDVVWAETQRGNQMTADLVAELRGIIAAKPPHVTVLADNEEVYPIRVELLREAADAIESGHEANVNCNRNLDHLMARLAAQQTILSTLEGERRRLTERLAAAERVVQAARLHFCGSNLQEMQNREHGLSIDQALEAYEKAYSDVPTVVDETHVHKTEDLERIFGKDKITDLNSGEQK